MQAVPASKFLTREERKMLLLKNDWVATKEVAIQWAWIFIAFALPYFFPNVLTVLISLFILGGKQLACAILMHDASHLAVFKKKSVNDFVGQWFGAYPIFQDVIKYRPYHQSHHFHNGLEEDPDLLLTRGYPTSRKSMIRKFTRDLTGLTGVKTFVGFFLMNMGYIEYNLGKNVTKISQKNRSWADFFTALWNTLSKPIFANLVIFSILYFFASGWLYLLWVVAYFTTFQFSLRVRSMAEHSVLEDQKNPFLNTRTTYANFFEKLLFAPYYVNYHAEHHMLMGVPSYNLPKMHRLIKAKGYYEKGVLEKNYWNVIQLAIQE